MSLTAAQRNSEYYARVSAGTNDYWRKMAAPRFRRATLLRVLQEQPPRSLVDLGCGGGQLLGEIGAQWPQALLTGLDLSPEQMDFNRSTTPHIAWHALDLCCPEALPVSLRGRFDTLVASELIEHLDDPGALLRTARALARADDSRLLLSTQSGPVRATERSVGHVRHFSRPEMEALLRENGWRPLRVWNAGWPFHDLSKWWANRNPQKSLAQFGDRPYGWKENLICWLLRILFWFNSQHRGAQLFAVAVPAHDDP